MRTEKYSPERVALYERYLKDGLPYRQVAMRFGVSEQRLAVVLPGYGGVYSHGGHAYVQFHILPETRVQVEAMLDRGYSLAEVSREFDVKIEHLYAHYPQYAYTPQQSSRLSNLRRR